MSKQVLLGALHVIKGALSAVVPIATVAGAILGGVSALTAYLDTTIRPMRKGDG